MSEQFNDNQEKLVRHDFELLRGLITEVYDFPELKNSRLEVVDNAYDPRNASFPLRISDSRHPNFIHTPEGYNHYLDEFKSFYGDDEPVSRGLDNLASLLYVGAGLVQPVITFDLFERYPVKNGRHVAAVKKFYQDRRDISAVFEDVFGIDPIGPMHAELSQVLRDEDVMRINGLRAAFCYLYGALRRSNDKSALGELVTASRQKIYDHVVHTRDDYRAVATPTYGETAQETGDMLLMDTMPTWLIALATPMKPESFDHLGKKFWQDKFAIEEVTANTSTKLGSALIERSIHLLPTKL